MTTTSGGRCVLLRRSVPAAPGVYAPALLIFVAQLRSVLHVRWARVVLVAVMAAEVLPLGSALALP